MEQKKVLSISDFVYLLLATLAQDSGIIDLKDKSKKIVTLPIQYKQIIECILCAENGWKEEFSVLIDIKEYFDDHFMWEQKLGITLKQVLVDLNKNIEYDSRYDKLLICFTDEEIKMIFKKYPDEELKYVMNHFASLLVDYIYTRKFQEEYCDYYALTVAKLHNMNKQHDGDKNLNAENKSNNKENKKQKIRSLFKW